jgi:hypothetical protein
MFQAMDAARIDGRSTLAKMESGLIRRMTAFHNV